MSPFLEWIAPYYLASIVFLAILFLAIERQNKKQQRRADAEAQRAALAREEQARLAREQKEREVAALSDIAEDAYEKARAIRQVAKDEGRDLSPDETSQLKELHNEGRRIRAQIKKLR